MSDQWEHVVKSRFPSAIVLSGNVFVIAQRAVYFAWLGVYESMEALKVNEHRLFTQIQFTGATLYVDHRRRAMTRWSSNREKQIEAIRALSSNPISGS